MSCWRYCATEVASMAGLSGGALAGTGGGGGAPRAAGGGRRSVAGAGFFGAGAFGRRAGRHGADRAELAAALHAEEVGLARHAFVEARAHRRQVRGARHAVVHQRPGEELAALVVHRLLVERLSGALRDAAMHLPFDDHVIDDAPDVVAAREARELDLAGFTIDLHLAGLRAVRPRRRRRRFGGRHPEYLARLPSRELAERDRSVGAG